MTEDTLREEAVAAQLAGDVARANDVRQALAACLEASIVETQLLIAVATAAFVVPALEATAAGRVAAMALRPIDERGEFASGLERPLAAAAAHLAVALADRPAEDRDASGLGEALDLATRVSNRLREKALGGAAPR